MTFVTIGYRLAPAHVFPAGYDDVADAIVHVASRLAAHGADPDWLYVGGHSAGGHYAALLATLGPKAPRNRPGAGDRRRARPARRGTAGLTPTEVAQIIETLPTFAAPGAKVLQSLRQAPQTPKLASSAVTSLRLASPSFVAPPSLSLFVSWTPDALSLYL